MCSSNSNGVCLGGNGVHGGITGRVFKISDWLKDAEGRWLNVVRRE